MFQLRLTEAHGLASFCRAELEMVITSKVLGFLLTCVYLPCFVSVEIMQFVQLEQNQWFKVNNIKLLLSYYNWLRLLSSGILWNNFFLTKISGNFHVPFITITFLMDYRISRPIHLISSLVLLLSKLISFFFLLMYFLRKCYLKNSLK